MPTSGSTALFSESKRSVLATCICLALFAAQPPTPYTPQDAMKSQPSIIAFLIPLLVLIMVLFAYREKPRLRTPANGFYLAFLVGLLAVVLGYATVIWEIPALFQLSYLLTVFMACSTLTVGTTVLPVGNIWAVLFSLAVMLLTAIITGYAAYKDVIP